MYNKIKSFLPILMILVTLMGCTLLQDDIDPVLSIPDNFVGQGEKELPISEQPSSPLPFGDAQSNPSSSNTIEWQIEFRGDPGIHRNESPTHLPAEKLTFIATFSQEMNRESVEKAFQKNLLMLAEDLNTVEPTLDFTWLNPLQVEVAFPGNDLQNHATLYTLSPNGAISVDHDLQLHGDINFSFYVRPNYELYQIDKNGRMSKLVTAIPNSLVPIAQNSDGSQLLLVRTYESSENSAILPYLFDVKNKQITKLLSKSNTYPFWGYDDRLHIIHETSLVHIDTEEQWIEFGDYPYIHGWTISKNKQYEVYLLSKGLEAKNKLSILVKDLSNATESLYENVLPMNNVVDHTIKNTPIPIRWINEQQVYISLASTDESNSQNYIVNIVSGETKKAPDFLQVQTTTSKTIPEWSSDGAYVAVYDQSKLSGIFDADGQLLYEWNSQIPEGSFFWNPTQAIVAYKATFDSKPYIVQYHIETGNMTMIEGDYFILGWNVEGTMLQVYK